MRNLLNDCVQDLSSKMNEKVNLNDFQKTFCLRCRNPECELAGWKDSKFDARIAMQEDRLTNPVFADPTLSKYQFLTDFKDYKESLGTYEVWGSAPANFTDVEKPSIITSENSAPTKEIVTPARRNQNGFIDPSPSGVKIKNPPKVKQKTDSWDAGQKPVSSGARIKIDADGRIKK